MASSDADLSSLSAAELVSRLSNKPGDLDAVVRVLSAREAQHKSALAEIGALRKNSQRIQEELRDHLTAALSGIDEALEKGAFKLDALLAGRYNRWEGTLVFEVYEEHKERLGRIAAEVRAKISASFSKVVSVEEYQQQQQDQDQDQDEVEEIAPVPAAAIPVQQTVMQQEGGRQDDEAVIEQERQQKVFRDEALDVLRELDLHFGARLRPYRVQMAQIVNHFLNPLPHASTEDLRRWLSAQPSPVQQTVVKEEGHLVGTVSEHEDGQQRIMQDEQLLRDVGSFLQERLRQQMDQFVSRYTNGTRSADESSRGTSSTGK